MSTYRRATRPLNSDAVRAAKAAVASDTTPPGRPLTMGPERGTSEEMDGCIYYAADGKGKEVKPSGKKPNDVKEPCPCKPITSIKLVSVGFPSDHMWRLKDYTADWKDGGSSYSKPEWTSSHQHPISHTMDKTVTVDVIIEVKPDSACPETGTLRGEGPAGMVLEKTGITFKAGQSTYTLTSSTKLEKKVQELDFRVKWKTIGTSVSISPSQTANKMYVTYDTPSNSVVTLKRLSWACNICKNQGDIDSIVLAAHKHINANTPPKFNVSTNEWPAGTPPIWLMLDSAHSGGSCIAHSNLLKHVANILGVPDGSLEKVYSSTDSNFSTKEIRYIGGRRCTVVVVAERSSVYYEWNFYEACLKINGKWYPGAFGDKSYPSAKEVHKEYASPLNRLVYMTDDGGTRKFFDKNGTAYTDPTSIPHDKCIPIP